MKFYIIKILYWSPRILGLIFSFFMSLFATTVFNEDYSTLKTILGFFVQLIPAIIILFFTIIGWRKEGLGAILFFIIAFAYILHFKNQPWQTYVIISGPLFFIGFLFFITKVIRDKNERQAEKRI